MTLIPLKGYWLVRTSGASWLAGHEQALLNNAGLADVIYTRWNDPEGRPFPFSPYRKQPHLNGMDFVGTEVLLGEDAAETFRALDMDSVPDRLRELARQGFTFFGVNEVTYWRLLC